MLLLPKRSYPEISVIINDEVFTSAGDIMLYQCELNQLVRKGAECICPVSPQLGHLIVVLSCHSNQMFYYTSVLQTAWHSRNSTLIDISVRIQEDTESPRGNAEDLYLHTQQRMLVYLGVIPRFHTSAITDP